jgi:hypothetical protein
MFTESEHVALSPERTSQRGRLDPTVRLISIRQTTDCCLLPLGATPGVNTSHKCLFNLYRHLQATNCIQSILRPCRMPLTSCWRAPESQLHVVPSVSSRARLPSARLGALLVLSTLDNCYGVKIIMKRIYWYRLPGFHELLAELVPSAYWSLRRVLGRYN